METVEKVAEPLFRVELHEILASISCEIVGQNFARGIISEAQKVNWPKAKRSHPGVCPRK
ncbi:hypothetical protein B5F19_14930 [Pseudoflavonifractor sp. An184]|nr:hypothetical protein B5F19_14930 [Pseudoflavonifractor sp. An184]